MKKMIAITCLSAVLFACNDEKKTDATVTTTPADTTVMDADRMSKMADSAKQMMDKMGDSANKMMDKMGDSAKQMMDKAAQKMEKKN